MGDQVRGVDPDDRQQEKACNEEFEPDPARGVRRGRLDHKHGMRSYELLQNEHLFPLAIPFVEAMDERLANSPKVEFEHS